LFGRISEKVVSFYSKHDCTFANKHQRSPRGSKNLGDILQTKSNDNRITISALLLSAGLFL